MDDGSHLGRLEVSVFAGEVQGGAAMDAVRDREVEDVPLELPHKAAQDLHLAPGIRQPHVCSGLWVE